MRNRLTMLMIICIMTVLCILPTTALADNISSGDYIYNQLTSTTCEIVQYSGTEPGSLIIPGTIDGLTVTGIGNGAFQSKAMTGAEVPEGVTYLGNSAFWGCSSLASISLPSTLTSIGSTCFTSCIKLTGIDLPGDLTAIGDGAFSGNTLLASVTMHNKVISIGSTAFLNCSKLESITLSDKLQAIGQSTFQGSGLTSIDIPASVQTIGSQAFVGCPLTSVTLHKGLVTIGQAAFNQTAITEITIPDTVSAINQAAFANCASLTKATILNSEAVFGFGAFGSDTCSIYGFADSTAEDYALNSGESGFTDKKFPFNTIYKVTYSSNKGSEVDPEYVESGDTVTKPEDPTRTNYVFAGWYKDNMLTDDWDFDTDTVTKNITLYAKWYYVDGMGYYYADNEYDQLKKFLDSPSALKGVTNGKIINTNYDPAEPVTFTQVGWDYVTIGSGEDTHTLGYVKGIYWNSQGYYDLNGDLDLSNFKNLLEIDIEQTQIDSIKVENDTAVKTLIIVDTHLLGSDDEIINTGITTIDVSTCTALQDLRLYGNLLTELNIENNTELVQLNCRYNDIEVLNLDKNTKLETVYCEYNKIKELDTHAAGTNLTELSCGNNEINKLTITGNINLNYLDFGINQISGNLDLSDFTLLELVNCSDNALTSLNLHGCTKLENLHCYNNSLSGLSIGSGAALEYLFCDNNLLGTSDKPFDVSAFTGLINLSCGNNKLDSLDVSANTNLEYLSCDNNKIESLDVSHNSQLFSLECSNNQLTGLIVSANTGLKALDCGSNGLTALDVSKNTDLEYLLCDGNTLGSLDITKNTALAGLDCSNCGLSSLDISKNTELGRLYCDDNSLTSLNISNRPELFVLSCKGNKLTMLSTTGDSFDIFDCTGNQLAYIKASIYGNVNKRTKYTIELKAKGSGYVGAYAILRSPDMFEEEPLAESEKKIFVTAEPKTDIAFIDWTNSKGKEVSKSANYNLAFDTSYSLTANYDNLAIPSNLAATPTAYNKIALSWDAVKGAAGYRIYRATSLTGKYSYIKSTTYTSYVNKGVTTGRVYFYKVAAYDKKHTGKSCDAVHTNTILGQVTGAKAVSSYPTSAKISWDSVLGATSYNVYCCDAAGNIIKKLKNVTGKSYTKTGLVPYNTYYYKVKALRGSASGDYSGTINVTPIVGQVSGVKAASASQTSVKLTWKSVAGATKYEVSRSDTADGIYTNIGTVSSASYTNISLTFGQTYYYKVKAYYKTYSGVDSAVASAIAGQVTGVKASSSYPTKAVISWSTISGATEYHILRCSADPDGMYADFKTVPSKYNKYTDTELLPGRTYYYKVVAYFGTVSGEASDYVSVTPDVAKVSGVKATRLSTSKVKVYWKAVTGADGYEITVSSGGGTPAVIPGVTKTYYYITPAPKISTGYEFTVRAYKVINGITYFGEYSDNYLFTK